LPVSPYIVLGGYAFIIEYINCYRYLQVAVEEVQDSAFSVQRFRGYSGTSEHRDPETLNAEP